MKNILLFIICSFSFQLVHAQNITLDKEKLLEFYQTQRYAEAALYLQSVYPENTQDVKALAQIAYCNMMANKLPDAERSYLKIYAQQPNYLPVLFNLANINSRRGNEAKARVYLERIVKLDTLNFKAYKQLADLVTDSVTVKLAYLKKANHLNPEDPDVAYDLSQVYKSLNNYVPGYEVLKVAITADTSNLFLLAAQLPFANELKKYQEVVTVGEKLLQNQVDANVLKDVGKAYFFLKNYQKCITLYKLIEDVDQQTEVILYYLTLSYRELKKYDLAESYAKKTIEEGISPNTSMYYALLAGIYETNNSFTNSVNAYKKGLTYKANGSIYYRLALLYDLKLNQKKNAITYYNLYLKSKLDVKKENEQIAYSQSRLLVLKK